ncbi:MAG: hypothetical protein AAFY98_01230 [Verrucomicrobiota bacterium]
MTDTKSDGPAKRPVWRWLLLALGVIACAVGLSGLYFINAFLNNPEPLLDRVAGSFGQELELESLEYNLHGQLIVRDLSLKETDADREYVQIDYLEINWAFQNLRQGILDELRVHGIRIWLSRIPKAEEKGGSKLFPFTLKTLILGQATLMLEGLGEGIPPIPVKVGETNPMVFNDLKLGGAESDPAAQSIQTARAFNISINSPLDPLAPVLFFSEIEFHFSWAGIQQKVIDQLAIRRPVLYVGQDLFWFVKLVQQGKVSSSGAKSEPSEQPWSLSNFSITDGEVIVTTFGRPGYSLPVTFHTEKNGLVLGSFNELALDIRCEVEKGIYDYRDEYGVIVEVSKGDLEFSLPPKKNANNVVQTIEFSYLDWKGLRIDEAYISMTFDERGLFAKFEGEKSGGYVGGDLSVFADRGFDWVASTWATDLEALSVSQKLSPENLVIEGVLDGTFIASGKANEILNLSGDIDLKAPGVMTISAVDEVLRKLPADWGAIRKELTSFSLEAFRRYDYHEGKCTFNYSPRKSFVQLRMDGEQGERNFDLRWVDLRKNSGFSW